MVLLFQRYLNQSLTILFNFLLVFIIFRIEIDSILRIYILSLSSIATYFSFSDLFTARLSFAKIIKKIDVNKNLRIYLNNLLLGNLFLFATSAVIFYLLLDIKNFLIILALLIMFCVLGCAQSMRLIFNSFEIKEKYEKTEIYTRVLFILSLILLYFEKFNIFLSISICTALFFVFQINNALDEIASFTNKFEIKNILHQLNARTFIFLWQLFELFMHYFFFVIAVNLFIEESIMKETLLLWFRVLLGLGAIIRIPIDVEITTLTQNFVDNKVKKLLKSNGLVIALALSGILSLIFYYYGFFIFSFISNAAIASLPSSNFLFIILFTYPFLHILGSVVINSGLYTKLITFFCGLIVTSLILILYFSMLDAVGILQIYVATLLTLLLSNSFIFLRHVKNGN